MKKFLLKKRAIALCVSIAVLSEGGSFCSRAVLPFLTTAKAVARTHPVDPFNYKILKRTILSKNGITLPMFEIHDRVSEKFEPSFNVFASSVSGYFDNKGCLLPEAERYFRAILDKIFSRKCIVYDENVMLPVSVYAFGIPDAYLFGNIRKSSVLKLFNCKDRECHYSDQASFYKRFYRFDDETKRSFLYFLDACDEIYEKEKTELFFKNPTIKANYEQAKKNVNCFKKSEYAVLEEIARKLKLEESFYKTMKYTQGITLSFENLSDKPAMTWIEHRNIDTNCHVRLKMVFHNTLPIVDAAMKEIYGIPNLDIINNDLNRIKAVYAKLIEGTSENVSRSYFQNNSVFSPEIMVEQTYLLATFGANRSSLFPPNQLDFFNNNVKVRQFIDFYANNLFSLENVYNIAKPLYEADGITSFDGFGPNGTIDKTEDKINFGILCSALGVDESSAKQDLLNEINKEADGEEKAFEFNDLYSVEISKEDMVKFINGEKNMRYRNVVLSTDKIGNIILFLLSKSKLHYYKDSRKSFSFSSAMSSKVDDDTVLKSKNALLAVFVLIDMYEHGLTTNYMQEDFDEFREDDAEEEDDKEISANLKALQERKARDPRDPEWEQLKFYVPESFEYLIKDVDRILGRIGGPLEIDPRFKRRLENVKEVSSYTKSVGDLNRVLVRDEAFYTRGYGIINGEPFKFFSNEVSKKLEEAGARKNWIIDFYNHLLQYVNDTNYGLNVDIFSFSKDLSNSIDMLVEIKKKLLCIETHLNIAKECIPKLIDLENKTLHKDTDAK